MVAKTLYKQEELDLRRFLSQYSLPVPDAEALLAEALARAQREQKRVLIQFTGTFCGPCWTLSRYIHAHDDVFEPNYVYLKIDGRYTGAIGMRHRYQNLFWNGIPWCAVLDAEGKLLANWDGPGGENIGFPSEPAAIDYFLEVISTTAPQVTPEQIAQLRADLQKKQ